MSVIFARALSHLRHEKGISQRLAAQELGISQALLSHYENGIREPGLAFVLTACDYSQVSADYLLGRTGVEYTPGSGSAADPDTLMHLADRLSQACVDLSRQEPRLGILFQRLATQLSRDMEEP